MSTVRIIAAIIVSFLIQCIVMNSSFAAEIALVQHGKPVATIVTDVNATESATLAAMELQYHIKKMTGAILPIITADKAAVGVRILVGESAETRKLGMKAQDFASQEYLIRFLPETIVLIGRDWIDNEANRKEIGIDAVFKKIEDYRIEVNYKLATEQTSATDPNDRTIMLPGIYDDQGTCYAAYDFLERFCDVRWFGPGSENTTYPVCTALIIKSDKDIRRSPVIKLRTGSLTPHWPIIKNQWGSPGPQAVELFWRRMRLGGEKWTTNHSFMSYCDRFGKKNPANPELFERERPEFFAQGQTAGQDVFTGFQQLCYTNPELVEQVAQDARDYFDGKGLKGSQPAMGNYFVVMPHDNKNWCKCDACQKLLAIDAHNAKGEYFNCGLASHYWFSFVNAVARELRKTHPDKYLATGAYWVYAYKPDDVEIETNISVSPCLQPRNYWAPKIRQSEIAFYKKWVEKKDRPIYLWNYYNFPEELTFTQAPPWKCFPGFSAHLLADQIKMYAHDGVRGVLLCGMGEQVDFYITMKLYDDPSQDIDNLLDEFFNRYFGAASKPMQEFYTAIEQTYTDPNSYPAEVREKEKQFHQNEEIAWKYLGTPERMDKLELLIEAAQQEAKTDMEKQRVAQWTKGVWEYMVEGRNMYLQRQGKSNSQAERKP